MRKHRLLACIAIAAAMAPETGCNEAAQPPAAPTVSQAPSPPPTTGKGKRAPKVLTNLQNNNTALTQ